MRAAALRRTHLERGRARSEGLAACALTRRMPSSPSETQCAADSDGRFSASARAHILSQGIFEWAPGSSGYRQSAIVLGVPSHDPASLIREARQRAGLSQVELGRRAGVTQSVVSAYESGARQPSVPMLERLVRASGGELEILLLDENSASPAADRRVARKLLQHKRELRDIIARYGLANPRVFGSVARGNDSVDSDLDILVDVPPGVGLFALARCQRDVEALLGVPVDLVPADGLKPPVALSVLSEARPL